MDRAVAQRGVPATDVDHCVQLDWAQRIRLYNRHTVGNQERLSISSVDTDDHDARIAADFGGDVTSSHDDDITGNILILIQFTSMSFFSGKKACRKKENAKTVIIIQIIV